MTCVTTTAVSGLNPLTRVLLATDKFKGSLTASQVAAHLAAGIAAERPDVEVVRRPVADGGEGTLVAAESTGFVRQPHGGVGAEWSAGQRELRTTGHSVGCRARCGVSGLAQLPGQILAP